MKIICNISDYERMSHMFNDIHENAFYWEDKEHCRSPEVNV